MSPAPYRASGHGWVYPNPDGSKSRCGGPAICRACAADKAHVEASRMWAEQMQAHQYDAPYDVMAQMLEVMKGQLLLVFVNRLGGRIEIPVSEVDATGGWLLNMAVDQDRGVFTFETRRKS